MTYVQNITDKLDTALPGLDPELVRLYALLALTRGTETTLEDVHDAWSLWRMSTRPDHQAIVPFNQLSLGVQELDRMYRDAIVRAAEEGQ